jgi:hypothetical protein
LTTLTNLADGIAVGELVSNTVLAEKVHDVPELLLASRRSIQVAEPVLNVHGFQLTQQSGTPRRNNPVLQVALDRFCGE